MPERSRAESGYTLVEVVIAMLLTSIMVSSVFSVALTAKQSGGKAERRLMATQVNRQMTGMLRNFVTADNSASSLPGPNAGVNRWSMDNAAATPPINDTSCLNCYALDPGSHTVTGILPSWFAGPPFNATLEYYVAGTVAANPPLTATTSPSVNVTVNWTEP